MAASTCNVDVTSPVDLGALLDAGKGAVVTLVSGETQLAAHRAVLAARSPVFEAMFRHETRESSSGEVAVDDVPGPVLRQLLVYCYTLKAPQLPSMALQLLPAADKYGLLALRAECEDQLAKQLTVETAAATAVVALRHSCHSLKQAVASFMKAHISQLFMTQGWEDALVDNPDLAVELTRLTVEPHTKTSTPPAAAASGGSSASQRQSQSQAADRPAAPPQAASTSQYSGAPPAASGPSSASQSQSQSQSQAADRVTAPPDEAAISRYRSLSADEKGNWLREAAGEGSEDEVRALLAAGADAGAGNWYGETPMHWAALEGRAAVVRLLAAASADLNCRDGGGWTPLHCAAYNGEVEAAVALLQLGADRAARDDEGLTPQDVAREYDFQGLAELIGSW